MHRPLFIVWNAKSDTGVALIDEQHKGIVSIINTFYHFMGQGMDNKILYACISDTIKNYSRVHFITEESFLEAAGYPDIEQHKKLHRNLSLKIEQIEHEGIRANDAKPLLEFLKQWWLEHINEKDRGYAQYLLAHSAMQRN